MPGYSVNSSRRHDPHDSLINPISRDEDSTNSPLGRERTAVDSSASVQSSSNINRETSRLRQATRELTRQVSNVEEQTRQNFSNSHSKSSGGSKGK